MIEPSRLELPAKAAAAIADAIRRFGEQGLETGGFVLAPEGTERVGLIAVAGKAGIVRRWGRFEISELALDRLFGFADDHGLWAPAQFHSHRLGDELSDIDRDHGLRVGGFISAVVSYFMDPSCDPSDWGWWRFEADAWVRIGSPLATEGSVQVVIFDEDGVRGA